MFFGDFFLQEIISMENSLQKVTQNIEQKIQEIFELKNSQYLLKQQFQGNHVFHDRD